MPFPPPKGIYAGRLSPADPSKFDNATLKAQLEAMGLNCAQLTDDYLRNAIEEVNSQLPRGLTQSFAIKAPATSPAARALGAFKLRPKAGDVTSFAVAAPQLVDTATGNWTINNQAEGYSPHLEIIQYPDHFNWLFANKATNGFTGVKDEPPAYTGNYPNGEAIQKLFVDVCLTASATLVKGLDQPTMQATLSNVIQPLQDANLDNYDVSDSRAIFLVDNYNPSTGAADGIGVVYVSWRLQITDWKRKTKHGGDTHPVNLLIKSGSVLYYDASVLCADYNAVLTQFGINPGTAPACPVPT